jgi:hypothetical protein
MTDEDRKGFAELLLVLAETFNEPVSDVRARAYFQALRDLELEDLTIAANQWIARKGRFFPKPAELRELLEGATEDRGMGAWRELTEEIRRVGYYGTPKLSPATDEAMRATWGSWQAVCRGLPAPGSTQFDFEHKRFVANFTARDRQELALQPSRSRATKLLADLKATLKVVK